MWLGFWVNASSGILLVMVDATKMLTNPLFYIKIGFITLAVVSGRLLWNQVFRDPFAEKRPLQVTAKIWAVSSLLFWIAAITAGRLTAYLFSTPG
jgi:cytochrome b561